MESNTDGTEYMQNNTSSSIALCDIPSKLREVEMKQLHCSCVCNTQSLYNCAHGQVSVAWNNGEPQMIILELVTSWENQHIHSVHDLQTGFNIL